MKSRKHIFIHNFTPGWPAWILTAVIIIFGLALLIWPGQTTGLILNFISGILLAIGAFLITRYCIRSRKVMVQNMDLGFGITFAVLGLLVYLMKGFLISLIPTIIGVILLVSGFLKLQTALDFRRMNVHRWQLQMVISIISIAMGFVILVNPFGTALLMTRIIGAAILIEGVQDLLSMRTFKDAYNVHYTHFTDRR